MLHKLIDLQHPWFIPLYRRVIVTGICIFWTVVEFAQGAPFWGVLFAGLAGFCLHQFFIAFAPRDPEA